MHFQKKQTLTIFNSINEFFSTAQTVVTLGTFDGVHRGHQKIIERLISESKKMNCQSLLLTFLQHPRTVLHQNSDVKLLSTNSEKEVLLLNCGLDNLVVHPFDEAFASLSAEDFVSEILVKKFNIAKIIIGHDHRFGKNRSADINDLIGFGHKYGFEVAQISAQEIAAVAVSSTKIRNALQEGNILMANEFLGYEYAFSGKVVMGKQLGRTIGVPTANIEIDNILKLIPKMGVYVVESLLNKKIVFGVMNIGNRPTVDGKNQTIEVHFLDFDADLYEKTITIKVLQHLRDEKKFDALNDLKLQIQIDKQNAMLFLRGR